MKRFFKKFNKRSVLTICTVIAIFVMSLGYAALSQYMEIEGMAIIDRNWIIEITNFDVNEANEGLEDGCVYVGSTATMNAILPQATSTVTYTLTLENKGNIRAKLHSIEKVEDDNSSITYTISGVEEGVTELNPGETNTVTVTIKAKDGVTNLTDTEKSIMLSFYYVENTLDDNYMPTDPNTYTTYSFGQAVRLKDGSLWYVTEDSDSELESYITLFADSTYGDYVLFDSAGATNYDPTSETNVGYYVDNTIIPMIKANLEAVGGDASGLNGRLLTIEEYWDFYNNGYYYQIDASSMDKNSSGQSTSTRAVRNTWLMNSDVSGYPFATLVFGGGPTVLYSIDAGSILAVNVRPVIRVLKSNIVSSNKQTLAIKIRQNTTAVSDSSLTLSNISSSSNGQGLYYRSTSTEGGGTTYYFRGAVTNNYVKFAGYYWRIVRINEDGSIRLIYQGTTATATGANAAISTGAYNSTITDNAHQGFMYGTAGSTTYAATHQNTNDSTVKNTLESWYDSNLLPYAHLLAAGYGAGFCNDRSLQSGNGYGTANTYYKGYNRLLTNKSQQFLCPQTNDLFTLKNGAKGNKALNVPIGLISADEVMFAGGKQGTNNTSFYLYTGQTYYTMTPYTYSNSNTRSYIFVVNTSGKGSYDNVGVSYGIRPVINLNKDVEITDWTQTGTATDPYIIKTEIAS